MLIAIQFPFTDVRPFLQGKTHLITTPAWGNADTSRDFIRGVGPLRPRRKGALSEWPEEDAYCHVSRALRFDPSYHLVEDPAVPALTLRRYCAFRRFMADGRFPEGSVVARLELGFGFRPRRREQIFLSPNERLGCVTSTLKLPVHIHGRNGARNIPLIDSRNLFDDLYLRSTSELTQGQPPLILEPWWFRAGLPVAVVEFETDVWPPLFPPKATRVPALTNQGIELGFLRVGIAGLSVSVWFVAVKSELASRELLRRLRINLFRLHAERQSIGEVLRLVRQKKVPSGHGTDNLQTFLRDAINLLSRTHRDGLPQSEILTASAEAGEFAQPGERQKLLLELAKIRPAILDKVENYLKTQSTQNGKEQGTAMNKKRVFVSHASQDKPFVRQLVQELQKHELNVWFDEQEIRVGDSIVDKVGQGVDQSDYLIVVLSKAAVASRWVMEELNAALMDEISNKGTVILPVLAEDCEIPPLLKHRLYADFRADFQSGMAKLLAVFKQESQSTKQVVTGKALIAPAPCSTALASISLAELRRRLTHRMDRNEVGVVWFDVFNKKMDDDMPFSPKDLCIIELLTRAQNRNKLPDVIDALCDSRPDLATP